MFKTLKFLAAAIFAFGLSFQVHAAAIIGGNFTAVDDVSSSLALSTRGTVAYFHINGTYDMAISLQREVAPGSGAWETVMTDVAPTANTLYRLSYTAVGDNENVRLRVATDTSGTVFYSLFTGRQSPSVFTRQTHLNSFQEWYENDTALDGTDTSWQVMITPDVYSSGTAPTQVNGNQEGTLVGTVGSGNNEDTDTVAITPMDTITDFAALVSDGVTQVTWRVRLDDIVGNSYGFGMSDTLPIANTVWLFEINSDLVVDIGATDDIALHFSSDADGSGWGPASTNTGDIGNNAAEFACAETVAVDTYYRLTIEVEATGDAMFYVDDVLCAVEALALATDTRLLPYAYGTSAEDDTTGAGVFTMDYVDFYMARPTD